MNAYKAETLRAETLKSRKISDLKSKIETLRTCEIGTEINGFTVSTEARRARYLQQAQRNLNALAGMRAVDIFENTEYFLSDYVSDVAVAEDVQATPAQQPQAQPIIRITDRHDVKNIMRRAWQIARLAVTRFGGTAKEFFATSLKLAWSEAV